MFGIGLPIFFSAALSADRNATSRAELRRITANIDIHHVHHLCGRIPYYRLPQGLRDYPELVPIGRITLCESLRCVRLALWDEGQHRLVSFRDARASREASGGSKCKAIQKSASGP